MTTEAPRTQSAPISQILRGVLDHVEGETLTIGDIVSALGDRAMAILMILFSLPNCVPVPPGVGLVFGFPMILVALQMVLGRHLPWLPGVLLNRRLKAKDYARLMDVAEPRLKRVEAYLKPRYTFLFSDLADRFTGAFFVLCAVSVILPLPGSNFPPAVAAVLMSLAIVEEDGVVFSIGVVIGVIGLAYTTLVGGAVIWGAVAAARAFMGF
ncbi:exopolysaccharide biosynthesis protein [Blastochloris viridis]|uniref:exopolysaccharide biosynthesis protein n=1 Tax=Blastochloris viridis TaxID=1079 RepID=UPI001470835D|nr:exopolysaccharide biosynthesis protein [Blastochloris viridis]